jgi:hypothetical protein
MLKINLNIKKERNDIKKNKISKLNGDWGLGIGDWGLGPIPNPQSPIPNPQSPFIIFYYL